MNINLIKRKKIISTIVILVLFLLLIPQASSDVLDDPGEENDFSLVILSGVGYTLIIDNREGTTNLSVNHTSFGKAILGGQIVRNTSETITIPSGSLLIKTVHPVFCFRPLVNITVSLSASGKIITRNGLQLFSKIHIFLSGPRFV